MIGVDAVNCARDVAVLEAEGIGYPVRFIHAVPWVWLNNISRPRRWVAASHGSGLLLPPLV